MKQKHFFIITIVAFLLLIMSNICFDLVSDFIYDKFLLSTEKNFVLYLQNNYKALIIIEPLLKQFLLLVLALSTGLLLKPKVDNILVPNYRVKFITTKIYLVSYIFLSSIMFTMLIVSHYYLYLFAYGAMFVMLLCLSTSLFCKTLYDKNYTPKVSISRIGVLLLATAIVLINAHISINNSKINQNINNYYDNMILQAETNEQKEFYSFQKDLYSTKGLVLSKSSFFLKQELKEIHELPLNDQLEAEANLYQKFEFVVEGSALFDYNLYSANYKLYTNNTESFIFFIVIIISSYLVSRVFKLKQVSSKEVLQIELENNKVIEELLEVKLKLKENLHNKVITKEDYNQLLKLVEDLENE